MFKSVIVIFALFALTFAAPEPKADPKPKAEPGVYAAAYTVPTSAVFERSYHGNIFPAASYVAASPYVASPYVASSYVASPYVAAPYVSSPYVSAYTAPVFVR